MEERHTSLYVYFFSSSKYVTRICSVENIFIFFLFPQSFGGINGGDVMICLRCLHFIEIHYVHIMPCSMTVFKDIFLRCCCCCFSNPSIYSYRSALCGGRQTKILCSKLQSVRQSMMYVCVRSSRRREAQTAVELVVELIAMG